MNNIFTGTVHKALTLENKKIYRARWNEKGRLFTNTHELIYPKKEFAKKNRFNNDGQSFFMQLFVSWEQL